MKSKSSSLNIAATVAVFVLGNAVIAMPTHGMNLYGWILYTVLSLALLAIGVLFVKLIKNNSVLKRLVMPIIILVAVFGVVTVAYDYICFLLSEQLPQGNAVVLLAALGVAIAMLVTSREQAFFKYGFFMSLISAAAVIICFVSGIGNLDFFEADFFFDFTKFSALDFIRLFMPMFILPFFIGGQKMAKPIFVGAVSGFFILLLCIIQTGFTLGKGCETSYAYLKAVGVITSGSLFTRLDGLVYFLFFATAIIKITICLKVLKLSKLNEL